MVLSRSMGLYQEGNDLENHTAFTPWHGALRCATVTLLRALRYSCILMSVALKVIPAIDRQTVADCGKIKSATYLKLSSAVGFFFTDEFGVPPQKNLLPSKSDKA